MSGSKRERKGGEGGEGKREGGRGRVAKMTGREERIEGKKGRRINRKQRKEEERGVIISVIPPNRTALETIEKLSHTLDFTDHASQIIHALVHVLDQSPDLRPAAMETLCRMMTQLGQRYKIFIPMVKKVWEGRRRRGCGGGGRKERGGERRGMRKERGSGKKSKGRERGRAKAGTWEQGERVDGGKGKSEGEKERAEERKGRRVEVEGGSKDKTSL